THYFSALIILFQGIFLIICQREKLRSWIIHGAIVTALFLPWLPTFIDQFAIKTSIEPGIMIEPVRLTLTSLSVYNVFAQIGLFFHQYLFGQLKASTNPLFIIFILLGLATTIMAAYPLSRRWQASKPQTILILASLIGVTLVFFVMQYLHVMTVAPYPRLIIFISPLFYLLISNGISKHPQRTGLAIIGMIIILNVVCAVTYFRTESARENWGVMVNTATQWNPDAAFYVYPSSHSYNVLYYFKGPFSIIPTGTPFRTSSTFEAVFSEMRPIDDPAPCAFMQNQERGKDVVVIAMIANNLVRDTISGCFGDYTLSRHEMNTYHDIWGNTYSDIETFMWTPAQT
ncbi:MAG: hypothetical protein ABIH41_00885, partial [Nanoarchaeota archaeon]